MHFSYFRTLFYVKYPLIPSKVITIPYDCTPHIIILIYDFGIKKGMNMFTPSIIADYFAIMHALNNRQYEYLHECFLLAERIMEHVQLHLFQVSQAYHLYPLCRL